MSIVDELKIQIATNKIQFDQPAATAERLKKELLGENNGTKVTGFLQIHFTQSLKTFMTFYFASCKMRF